MAARRPLIRSAPTKAGQQRRRRRHVGALHLNENGFCRHVPPEERIVPTQDFGLGFSRVEAIQVWTGVGIMTLAFALAYIGGALRLALYFQLGGPPLVLLIITGSFVAVMTAFFLHELAHKAVAQRYGAVAEYRYSPAGLLAGLVTASIGLMLAIPGAVVISGRVTPRQQVRISVAGPATNLAFAALFIVLSLELGTVPGGSVDPLQWKPLPIIIGAITFINVLLAGFNLIPVPRIAFHRKIAGRFQVDVTLPASDGFLVLSSSKATWAASVVVLFTLGIGGRLLGVF